MELQITLLQNKGMPPRYAHATDAGLDLYLPASLRLNPHERKTIGLCFAMALPSGTVGLIRDKSSWPSKKGLALLGGVIDQGYRGEVKIILLNTTSALIEIEAGAPIAQLLIVPIHHPTVMVVDQLDETSRGVGGFGSTHEVTRTA
ncbi:dUTP diphosphatase [Candidatus Berkelbacteria bacterium]|nr:dUTP diphosphatase [Candidatus Berkelbacteria bacterium]